MALRGKTLEQDRPWERWGISKQEFDIYYAGRKQRHARTPQVGAPAPDFEIERLSPTGARTGEMFRLSSIKGLPVALVMGSYT